MLVGRYSGRSQSRRVWALHSRVDGRGGLLARAGAVVDCRPKVDVRDIESLRVRHVGHGGLSACRSKDTSTRTIDRSLRVAGLAPAGVIGARDGGIVVVTAGCTALTVLPLKLLVGLGGSLSARLRRLCRPRTAHVHHGSGRATRNHAGVLLLPQTVGSVGNRFAVDRRGSLHIGHRTSTALVVGGAGTLILILGRDSG